MKLSKHPRNQDRNVLFTELCVVNCPAIYTYLCMAALYIRERACYTPEEKHEKEFFQMASN